MKTAALRRHRSAMNVTTGIFSENPVLMAGLALPFAIGAATSMKNAAALSIAMAFSLVPTMSCSAYVRKTVGKNFSIVVHIMMSALLIIASVPAIRLIGPTIVDSLGVFLPLIAVNTIMVQKCELQRTAYTPLNGFLSGCANSLGFALAVLLVGAVREYLGSGTLWGIAMPSILKMPAMSIVFAGFIVVGFLSAFMSWLDRNVKIWLYKKDNSGKSLTASRKEA